MGRGWGERLGAQLGRRYLNMSTRTHQVLPRHTHRCYPDKPVEKIHYMLSDKQKGELKEMFRCLPLPPPPPPPPRHNHTDGINTPPYTPSARLPFRPPHFEPRRPSPRVSASSAAAALSAAASSIKTETASSPWRCSRQRSSPGPEPRPCTLTLVPTHTLNPYPYPLALPLPGTVRITLPPPPSPLLPHASRPAF